MHELPSIRVMPAEAALRPLLLDLGVHINQREHVGTITDMLADVAVCPDSEVMAIMHGDTPVGCYRLDGHARGVAGRDLGQPALGIRAFFIDAHWQERGMGTAALIALIADAADRYREVRLLALSASVDNEVALRLYRRTGFIDAGELYHGGRPGPQHLWLRAMP